MSTSSTAKKLLIGVVAIALGVGAFIGFSSIPQAQALTTLDDLEPGSLFRGESFPAVYYLGADGFRYVFPNQKAYDTWYSDFDDVVWISDVDLTKIQIGGNVTYKPGVRMVKIDSNPVVYVVEQDGVLRPVASEAAAAEMYGSDWNQHIDDIPDSFFGNYTLSDDDVTGIADYNPDTAEASVDSISDNMGLVAPTTVSVTDSGFDPTGVTISAGETVKFVNNGSTTHTATADDLSWGTGTMQPGGTYSKTFDEPGEYPFFDSYNGALTGAVIVE